MPIIVSMELALSQSQGGFGLGLGLSLALGIANEHGAVIRILDNKTKGTIMQVVFKNC